MASSLHLLYLISLLSLSHFVLAAYNPTDAVEFASASALAYCSPDTIQAWTCGAPCKNLTGYKPYYSNVVKVAVDQTLSFSMIYNPTTQRFVTTFRGTVGSIELLMEIVEGGALKYDLSSIPDSLADSYFYSHYANNLRSSFISQIKDAYLLFQNYEFVFTGHSLGGALTTLAAFDVVSSGIIPGSQIVLYNYGSPRVGNEALIQAIEAALPVINRVVHWKDIVPHVPPCVENLKGECVASGLQPDPNPAVPPLLWHAWHVQPQIFYNEANTDYVVCSAEDPKCADQFSIIGASTNDHGFYVNVRLSCDGVTAFLSPPLSPPETDDESEIEELNWY